MIVDLLVGGMYCYNIFLSFPFQSTIFQSIHFSSQTKQTFLFWFERREMIDERVDWAAHQQNKQTKSISSNQLIDLWIDWCRCLFCGCAAGLTALNQNQLHQFQQFFNKTNFFVLIEKNCGLMVDWLARSPTCLH